MAAWVLSGASCVSANGLVSGFFGEKRAGASSLCTTLSGAGGGRESVDAEDVAVSAKPPGSPTRGREAFPAAIFNYSGREERAGCVGLQAFSCRAWAQGRAAKSLCRSPGKVPCPGVLVPLHGGGSAARGAWCACCPIAASLRCHGLGDAGRDQGESSKLRGILGLM